jgi:hypothetical protein
MSEYQAEREDIDLEDLLEYSLMLLGNANALGCTASHEDRQRIQAALFPSGLIYENGTYRTQVSPLKAIACVQTLELINSGAGDENRTRNQQLGRL